MLNHLIDSLSPDDKSVVMSVIGDIRQDFSQVKCSSLRQTLLDLGVDIRDKEVTIINLSRRMGDIEIAYDILRKKDCDEVLLRSLKDRKNNLEFEIQTLEMKIIKMRRKLRDLSQKDVDINRWKRELNGK